MATVSRTWVFTADTEGLADVGDSANIPVAWDSGPQMLEFGTCPGGANDSERARGPVTAGKDWTVLFPGLPAGATVTDVQCTAYKYQRFASAGITNYRVRVRIVDSAGASVHSAGDLGDTTIAGVATDGAKVSGTVLASRAVDAGKQAAATIVALEVQLDRTGGAANNDFDVDDIAITITYALPTGSVQQVRIPNRNVGPMALRKRFRRAFVLPSPRSATQQTLSVDGAVTPAGALAKQDQKPLTGAVTPTGPLAKQAQKPLSGTLSAVGSLVKQAAKILTGATAPAGALSKQTQKPVAGSTTPTGSLTKLVSKFLSGTLSSAGSLVLTGVKLLSLSGGITPVGSLVKQTSKLLTGTISPAGALKRATAKLAGGNITPSGALIKQIAKNLAGTLTSAGTTVIRGVKLLVLGGGITPTGLLAKQDQKPLTGQITPAGTIRKSVAQRLTGIITPVGLLAKQARKTITGTLSSVGTLLTQFGSIAAAFITTRTRNRGPGSSLTRRGGDDGLTRSDPADGRTTSSNPGNGLTQADGADGDTRSDLGGS